jgi:hypothetical protein
MAIGSDGSIWCAFSLFCVLCVTASCRGLRARSIARSIAHARARRLSTMHYSPGGGQAARCLGRSPPTRSVRNANQRVAVAMAVAVAVTLYTHAAR